MSGLVFDGDRSLFLAPDMVSAMILSSREDPGAEAASHGLIVTRTPRGQRSTRAWWSSLDVVTSERELRRAAKLEGLRVVHFQSQAVGS